MRRLLPVVLLLAFLAALPACQPSAPTPPPSTRPAGVDAWFPLHVGTQAIRIQLAVTSLEQEHGLMERDQLGDNDGMIFIFDNPQQLHFWMKDTKLPLDIGYFDPTGTLREFYPMYPFNEHSVDSTRKDIRYALEMNQGWYDKHNLKAGVQLNLAELRAALTARNFEPNDFTPVVDKAPATSTAAR